MFFKKFTEQHQRGIKKLRAVAVMGSVLLMAQVASAASGCATVIDITSVNKPPMADIYRLEKKGVSTGSQVAQLLGAFTPLGALASAVADQTVEIAGSAIRRGAVESERKQESVTQKWDGVFDVTYKPDFGEPITITIRDLEIKRYNLEQSARVVMFDPKRDVLITTGEGQKVTRTRPSIHVPVSGLWSTVQPIPLPINSELTEDYKKFCFAGQLGPDYQSMSGPWDAKNYKQPYLTNDEIKEAWRAILALRSEVKDRPQGTNAEKNQVAIDLQELDLASDRMREYMGILNERSEKVMTAYKNRISVESQKLNELKQGTGLGSSLGIDLWLSFVNESMNARAQEYLAGKAKI